MAYINVVIPVYNTAAYLRETVASVLDQPFQDTHIVLVDDGSTDNSGILCDELALMDSRVDVIHQRNAGVSSARNVGIQFYLNGSDEREGYIAFLDSDDFWYSGTLNEELIDHAKKMKHDIVCFGMVDCNRSKTRYSHPERYIQEVGKGGLDAIWRIKNSFASCLYRIELLKEYSLRFFTGYKYSEDKYFRMQCAYFAKSLEFMPQILYVYRQYESSAMGRVSSVPPIDYFIPIIDGWIKSDDFINSFAEQTGKTIDAGYGLADIYFLDMAEEHFKRQGSAAYLYRVIESHPHYKHFAARKYRGEWDTGYKRHALFMEHPRFFELKYRMIGLVEQPMRKLFRSPMMRGIRNRIKYPNRGVPK